jgi:hypothetical protein
VCSSIETALEDLEAKEKTWIFLFPFLVNFFSLTTRSILTLDNPCMFALARGARRKRRRRRDASTHVDQAKRTVNLNQDAATNSYCIATKYE